MYKHSSGPHRALAFPDFCGLLIGLGLEQYRKGNAPAPAGEDEALEETAEWEGWDIPEQENHEKRPKLWR